MYKTPKASHYSVRAILIHTQCWEITNSWRTQHQILWRVIMSQPSSQILHTIKVSPQIMQISFTSQVIMHWSFQSSPPVTSVNEFRLLIQFCPLWLMKHSPVQTKHRQLCPWEPALNTENKRFLLHTLQEIHGRCTHCLSSTLPFLTKLIEDLGINICKVPHVMQRPCIWD